MTDNIEYCCDCAIPTGNAGKCDDSLYLLNGDGPFCRKCWQPQHIDELEAALKAAEAEVAELETRLLEKPAYHCPHCGDWFGQDELEALLNKD